MLLSNRPRGLSGTPVANYFGPLAVPDWVTSGVAQAKANGYSVPINAVQSGMGAGIMYANPDGTLGRIDAWQIWPLQIFCAQVGTANPHPQSGWVLDCSFISPPQSVWNAAMLSLGVQTIADQQAAAVAAAQAYAQQAAQTAAPGVNPADYNPANCLDCGLSPSGATGGSGGASSSSPAGAVASLLTGNVSLAGFNVPIWGLAAAGIALVFAMGGRR
jgi:hypothetical protein